MSWGVELESVVLGPLAGRPAGDWQKASPGQWTPAQIVEHLALALELSARAFEGDAVARTRRPKTLVERVATWFVFGLGWIPRGVKATRRSTPAPRVEAGDAERHFRDGLARWQALAARANAPGASSAFVRHPRMGELDFGEWQRFHAWHCRHHARQIQRRLAR